MLLYRPIPDDNRRLQGHLMASCGGSLSPALCSLALLLPLINVLSIGPVLGLYHRGYLGAKSGWYVSTLYHLIECVCGTCPTLGHGRNVLIFDSPLKHPNDTSNAFVDLTAAKVGLERLAELTACTKRLPQLATPCNCWSMTCTSCAAGLAMRAGKRGIRGEWPCVQYITGWVMFN
jgi:hypothetical protein